MYWSCETSFPLTLKTDEPEGTIVRLNMSSSPAWRMSTSPSATTYTRLTDADFGEVFCCPSIRKIKSVSFSARIPVAFIPRTKEMASITFDLPAGSATGGCGRRVQREKIGRVRSVSPRRRGARAALRIPRAHVEWSGAHAPAPFGPMTQVKSLNCPMTCVPAYDLKFVTSRRSIRPISDAEVGST